MKKGQTKTIEVFCDNGKEVTQKDREKMAEKLPGILKRVERKNKRIRAHNLAIDNKKKLFEEFDPHYDPETGILSNPKLSSGMGKIDDNSVLGILYQTLSSDETYSLKTNKVPWQQRSTAAFSLITHWEPNSFAFLGKNSGALSKNILCLDNKSNLKIMVAADAAEFLGKADHKRATFALFENIETRDWKRTKIDFNFQGIQFKWKGSLPHEDKIKF
jgi:HEAT repeat protein